MKHAWITTALAVAALAGCAIGPSIGAGSVLIELPPRATASAALDGAEYEIARIWLISGSSKLAIDGYEYIDVTDESVTIAGLLPDTYTVQIAFGRVDDGTLYSVTAYGESDAFRVSAGVTSRVTIRLRRQRVMSDEGVVGTGFVNAVVVDGRLYTLAETGALYEDGALMDLPELAGRDIRSISLGKFFETDSTAAEELWINTDVGVFPYRGGVLDTTFSDGIALNPGESLDIEKTFAYLVEDPDSGEFGLIIGLQGSGLDTLRGTLVKYSDRNDPAGWEWRGWSELDATAGLGDIRDALSGVGEVIYDVVFEDQYIYAATALQTLFLTSADLDAMVAYFEGLNDPAVDMDLDTVLGFFGVVTLTGGPDEGKTIKSVEVEGSVLYLGTNTRNDPHNGVLAARMDPADGKIVSDAVRVDGTDGTDVLDIVYGAEVGLTVAYSASTVLVLDDGALIEEIPFYAGLPGRVRDVEWLGSRLYVVGSEGTAYIDF